MFEYLNEKPRKEVNVKYVAMPELVGLSLLDAINKLKELNLDYEIDGEGGVVTKQLPVKNTKLQQGSTVVLITN